MAKNNRDNRPVNLDLFTIKFPITAIVSILHSMSGFALYLILPLVLFIWQASLTSAGDFADITIFLTSWYIKLLSWLVLSGLVYHIIAGLRHLLMDIHIGDSKQGGRVGAYTVITFSIIVSIVLGIFIW